MRQLVQQQVLEQYIPFNGGMDTVTPQMTVNPGTSRDCQNVYQDINSGYTTGMGYERFDGQANPSDAQYAMLAVTITGSVSVGDVLTDDTAAAYGTVIALPTGYAVLTKVTGLFATGNIKVGAAVVGTCVGPQVTDSASTGELDAQYTNLAADEYRDDITAVGGASSSGAILGVIHFNDVVYAWRNNVGGTAADIWKSSGSGWVQVPLGFELAFTSGGTYVPQEGDVITGATSTETATLTRIVLESGSWSGGDAAGRFIFLTQSGAFQAENLDIGANLNIATIAGDSSAITLLPSGNYDLIVSNFTGDSTTRRIYGADGVNPGFEFDGTTLVQIDTTLTVNIPKHVASYQNRLVFSFGPASQFSEITNPYQWDIQDGSAIIAVGDDVTGYQIQQGQQDTGSLCILARNSIHMLYNNGSGTISNWNLVSYKRDTGSIEWTDQIIGSTYFLDDKGIVELRAAQEFGNFMDAAKSNHILPWLQPKKLLVTHSVTIKEKNLYCIFFSDKSAIFATVSNGEINALMPQVFSHKVERIWSSEDSDGNEVVFFGDDDGFVYQYDKGTSFDGDSLEWWFETAYANFGSPYRMKRYRRGVFEISGTGFSEFYFSYSLGYGTTDIAQPAETLTETSLKRTVWDAFVWDAFVWDGVNLSPSDLSMRGTGENISLKLRGGSDYYTQIRFSGALLQYSPTRRKR